MSALGHKRTFAVQLGMSALHPKADMCSATSDVRFVPIADMGLFHSITWSAVSSNFDGTVRVRPPSSQQMHRSLRRCRQSLVIEASPRAIGLPAR